MKKSSREKRAMEPTINSTGRSVESCKLFSLMRGVINKGLHNKITFSYVLFCKFELENSVTLLASISNDYV